MSNTEKLIEASLEGTPELVKLLKDTGSDNKEVAINAQKTIADMLSWPPITYNIKESTNNMPTKEEYRDLVVTLESPADEAMKVSIKSHYDEIRQYLEDVATACKELDALKKKVFYKKQLLINDNGGDISAIKMSEIPRLMHGVVGITSECGEMIEAVLKHIDGEKLDTINLIEELGDHEWYQEQLCDVLGTNIDEVRQKNYNKLSERYKGKKFDVNESMNRNLENERKELEG